MRLGVLMAEITIHNVRDLGQDARRTLAALLGRRLAEQEQGSVTALAVCPAPSGDERRVAAQRLLESLKATSEGAGAIPHDQLE
jgi:hypothetical protein